MNQSWKPSHPLTGYFIAVYITNLCIFFGFTDLVPPTGLADSLFLAALCITYPLIYMMPVVLFAQLWTKIQKRLPLPERTRQLTSTLVQGFCVTLSGLLTVLLVADIKLFELYGFHINAFVINLLLTPGGIESLGSSRSSLLMAGAGVAAIMAFHVVLFTLTRTHQHRVRLSRWWVRSAVLMFLLLMLGERVAYGMADMTQDRTILKAAGAVPLYNHVTFRSLGKRLGIEPVSREDFSVELSEQALTYPLSPLQEADSPPSPNIIWLVSESMRRDQLSPAFMPNTWRESSHGWRYMNHYSGGNGTRQGLFSLFYGLHGSYWDSFLRERRSPLFMDLLQARGYDMQLFTSASFTYPEFDQTLFANVPPSRLHQFDSTSPWQRDRENTTQIIDFIRHRDDAKPFMVFMFFESTHARYDFPPESAIHKPYLEDLNYTTMTRESLAQHSDELLNRYRNAAHFIDTQLGRIYTALDEENLWDNTIVMMTGDHGEEFLENGFWGHNSGFSEHQLRTPMVMWIPGEQPAVFDSMTSHTDVVATLMPRMGITSPLADYTQGEPMDSTSRRDYIVASDWAGLCYLGADYKFTMPLNSSLDLVNELFTATDQPVDEVVPFLASRRETLQGILASARTFTEGNVGSDRQP